MSSLHAPVSRRVLLPLMELQQRARPSRRLDVVAFRAGLAFRGSAWSWSDDEKRNWMLGRLRSVLRSAARDTTYYRSLFARAGFDPQRDFSFEDFAELPVLEREAVREAGRELVSRATDPRRLTKDATGGSTGAPTVIWVGPEERGWSQSAIEFYLARAGAPRGSGVALLWGHHLDAAHRETVRERVRDAVANVLWLDCFRLSPERLGEYHERLERWRPACVVAYASALASLADHVLERGHRPSYPTRCFVTGAEKLLPGQRERIERAFPGKPVHERYGSRDVGPIGFQLEAPSSLAYAVDWPNILVEPEHGGDQSAILVTKLHADGMPMIRYRLGDIGRFGPDSTPGRPALELLEVVGRDVDRIWLPDGRWVHPIEFPHLMKEHPVREYTVLQRADYAVEVQVVPRQGFSEESRVAILSTLRSNLPGIPLDVVVVEELARTAASKLRHIVSEVEAERASGA